ncbi:MAG TPA: MMPL family transporter, partial [Acidimicrobiales bacterium]|nr:MMPL family transporter [Acidimicrobiales bacterium]
MFAKLARFVVSHAWHVIAAWVVLSAVVLTLSPSLGRFTSNNNSSFLPQSYESVKAQDLIEQSFPAAAEASGIVVVHRADGGVLSPTDTSRISGLAADLDAERIRFVASVQTSPQLRSANGRVQLVELVFDGQPGASGPNGAVAAVRRDTASYLAGSDLSAGLTGSASISVDSTKAYNRAAEVIAIATVLLILALLGLVFRSVVIAALPIVVIGVVHQVAQALTADLADWFDFQVGSDLTALLVVVMFGIGTDYIVFLLFRHREQLAACDDVTAALERSTAAVSIVIASAAATVAAAFAALLVASLESLRPLAPGLIVGVVSMLLAARTLVPAIVSLLGR